MIILISVVIFNTLITAIRLLLLKYIKIPYLGLFIYIFKNIYRNTFIGGLLVIKYILTPISGIILNYNNKLSILY